MKHKHQILLILALFFTATVANAAQVIFTPALILKEKYSDNIYLVPDPENDGDIAKEEDYITSASLSLTGQIRGRTAGFSLNYTPTYNAFAYNYELDYWRHTAQMNIWNDFSRNTRLEITDTYLETEDPLDNTLTTSSDEATQAPEIGTDPTRRGRNPYRTNVARMQLSHQFGARDNLYLAIQNETHEEIDPEPEVDVDDYTNTQPSMGWTYWFTQRWGLSFDGYYSNRKYVDENDREEMSGYLRILRAITQNLSLFLQQKYTYLDFDEKTNEDYRIHQTSLGIDYQFQETAKITLAAAYYTQDYEYLEDDEDENGWTVDSEIYKHWAFQRSYINLTGGSGYDINDTGTEDLGLNFFYQGAIDMGRSFSPRFSTNIFGSYRYDEYPNSTIERVDHTINTGINFRYQTFRWMFITLGYNYRDFQSDIKTQQYKEHSATLTITMRPSTPFRLN